jgi:hypothetical protein
MEKNMAEKELQNEDVFDNYDDYEINSLSD